MESIPEIGTLYLFVDYQEGPSARFLTCGYDVSIPDDFGPIIREYAHSYWANPQGKYILQNIKTNTAVVNGIHVQVCLGHGVN